MVQTKQKIREYLGAHPEGGTPKLIAVSTGLNVSTVKEALKKMNDVHRVTRGWYKVKNEGDGTFSDDLLSDWNFHNCILSIDGVDIDSIDVDSLLFDWGLVKCVISVGSSNKATCRVSSDFPLNVSSLCFVAGFFSEFFGLEWSDVFVSSVEFNRDFRNLRLDGVKAISVGSLVEQFKLYQKERGLRVEHKTSVPFSMMSIVDMLSQNPMSVDLHDKLNRQELFLSDLAVIVSTMNKTLRELIDRDSRS